MRELSDEIRRDRPIADPCSRIQLVLQDCVSDFNPRLLSVSRDGAIKGCLWLKRRCIKGVE
jgi:hypothetical protein